MENRIFEFETLEQLADKMDSPRKRLNLSGASEAEWIEGCYVVPTKNGKYKIIFINAHFLEWQA